MEKTNQEENELQKQLSKFEHVVVLMMENRSFDNLLGYLYSTEDIPAGKKFAGLNFGGPYFNTIPMNVTDGHKGEKLYTSRASSYFQPYPDPGEFYPHVNTQLFNGFNPASNSGSDDDKIASPYNIPQGGVVDPPPMTGFITDYISVLRALNKKGCVNSIYNFFGLNPKWFKLNDSFVDYKAIMECFEPDQVPVMAGLAKGFAVFDHWHCDVPSQTYTNRAFWHSGTSFGYVNNSPMKNWIENRNSPTLFNLLEEKGKDWKIYTDNIVSLTGVIHLQQLLPYHETNFKSYIDFKTDIAAGKLPAYSFVEPRFFTPHNDQHPSGYDTLIPIDGPGEVGSVLLGEKLIWEVYNAVKNSNGDKDGNGNTWKNTLLIITHDEHGGCFDHVPPSPAPAPDNTNKPAGQDDFKFDRLGIRVPMIMVSAYIDPQTIINTKHRHTSFLHTMCKKWGLPHLTDRDKLANDFTEVFNAAAIRDRSNWPDLPEPVIPPDLEMYDFTDTLIGDLEKNILRSVSQWKTGSTADAEKIYTIKQAMQYLHNLEDELPGADVDELTFKWNLV